VLRILHVTLTVFGVGLLAVLAFLLVTRVHTGVAPTRFEQALLCIEPPAPTRYNRTGLADLFAKPAGALPDCWRSVTLPHLSRAGDVKLSRNDIDPVARAWYRLTYHVPPNWDPADSLMIYVPRMMGSAWAVRIDGRAVTDNLDDWRMTWNRPLEVKVAPDQVKPGQNLDIAIVIAFEPQTGHSIGRINVGSASALARDVITRNFLQATMPLAGSVMLLVMGGFFLSFWLARRAEKINLMLAFACIAWMVSNLQYVLPRHDNATLEAWYSAVVDMSITWVIWLVYLFVLQLDRRFSRVIAYGMPPYVLIMSLLALPFFRTSGDFGLIYSIINAVVGSLLVLRVLWLAVRGGSLELKVIGASFALSIAAGTHDVLLLAQTIDAEGVYLLPYSGLLMFGSLLFAVQRRYVRAINSHELLSDSLAHRLAEREAELQANHARLLELERAQTLASERQRLMRDMHDGLGSALTTSLAMLETGNLDRQELTTVLRESVDDLRTVIDSLEPTEGDLVALLATLRFRLGKRLELAGIAVEWEMHDLPPLQWLGAPQALQLMRMVQELLTNILKHADASRVHMSASLQGDCIEVRIADNGRGFNPQSLPTARGRGLRYLLQRAEMLHSKLLIDSSPGQGTCARLLLPVAGTERASVPFAQATEVT
jgi:signal transduction histidine kinase